ncbi:MAG: putative toxin-antitoxin system toxin component, PIN family [Chloroflexi bacterium]|nr:putative toxin-antitoxin system toxin component, PIN family [Chloroflexota bacterium]MBK8933857.1 putative toxin-antitoxin system toxin component, PIN family [Chloroflexota bacterium]
MRIVADTNVLVSAAIKPNGRFAIHLRQGTFQLLVSDAVLDEMIDVLNRPRLRRKYNLTPQYIHLYLHLIRLRSDYVTPTETITACRDAKDNKFLELATAGQADLLVTNDADLLALHPFRQTPIIDSAGFVMILDANE